MSEEEVTDEELLRDIVNTSKELQAYRDISNGFGVLSELPEHTTLQKQVFHIEHVRFAQRALSCVEFLRVLERIKEKRGA
jgi:hypothetical protein